MFGFWGQAVNFGVLLITFAKVQPILKLRELFTYLSRGVFSDKPITIGLGTLDAQLNWVYD